MSTEWTPRKVCFQPLGSRRLEGRFDGGHIASDAGLLLAREVAHQMSLFEALAACFTAHRAKHRVEHALEDLLAQRVLGIVVGDEDLNDHDALRRDPLFAAAVGPADVEAPLASPSTLNRRKRGTSAAASDWYRRLDWDDSAFAGCPGGGVLRFEKEPKSRNRAEPHRQPGPSPPPGPSSNLDGRRRRAKVDL